MTHALPTEYWLAPQALNITLNAMGDPNKTLGSTAAGAMVMCFVKSIDGVIGTYDNGHSYRRWTLQAYNTAFGDDNEKYVYIAIPRDTTKTTALVVFPSVEIDIYGKSHTVTTAEDGTTTDTEAQVGSADYYYIYLHARISSTNGTTSRTWLNEDGSVATACTVNTGSLSTDAAVASAIATIDELLRGMFTPVKFVDNAPVPVTNLTDMQAIRANKNFFGVGGITAYGYGENSGSGGSGTGISYFRDLLDVKNLAFGSSDSGKTVVWNGTEWVKGTAGSNIQGATSFAALTDVASAMDAEANKVWGIVSKNGNTTVYGWLNQNVGKTYTEGNYIDISDGNEISVDFDTLKSALNIPDVSGYGDIVTHNANEFQPALNYTAMDVNDFTKSAIEALLTGDITSHTHSQYLTNGDIDGMLTSGNYSSVLNNVYAPIGHVTNTDLHLQSGERTKWNAAADNSHTHSNKATLDLIDTDTLILWGQEVKLNDNNNETYGAITIMNGTKAVVLSVDDNGNLKVSSDGSTGVANLYATGGVSAYGMGSGGSSSGGGSYASSDYININASTGEVELKFDDLKTALNIPSLSGYATESWVLGKNYLTEHQSLAEYAKKATTLAGYGITDAYTKAQSDGKYVTGLAVDGDKVAWVINGANANSLTVPFATKADKVDGYHVNDSVRGLAKSFLAKDVKNVSIPIGTQYVRLAISDSYVHFAVYYSDGVDPFGFVIGANCYSWGSNRPITVSQFTGYNLSHCTEVGHIYYSEGENRGKNSVWLKIVNTTKTGTLQILSDVTIDGTVTDEDPQFTNKITFDKYLALATNYKIQAELIGNASSATKLATARTLWGQSFDGSANVSGMLYSCSGINHKTTDKPQILEKMDGYNDHPMYGLDYSHCSDSADYGKSYTTLASYFGLYLWTSMHDIVMDTPRVTYKGNIAYKGTYNTYDMIKFIDGTDKWGNGVAIGGGGLVVIGSGESSGEILTNAKINGVNLTGGNEVTYLASDGMMYILSGQQSGYVENRGIYLDTVGKVGIGTITPAYLLDVNGTFRIDADKDSNNNSIDAITSVKNADNSISTKLTNNISIRHALDFQWYETHWQIGNVRGSGNNSNGFGITSGNSKLAFMVSETNTWMFGNASLSSADHTYIQIGEARIEWDKTNNALKVVRSDGKSAANLYATGGVSAYAYGKDNAPTVVWNQITEGLSNLTTIGYLTINGISTPVQAPQGGGTSGEWAGTVGWGSVTGKPSWLDNFATEAPKLSQLTNDVPFAETSDVATVNTALTTHANDTTVHVTQQEKNAWNEKQNKISDYVSTFGGKSGAITLPTKNTTTNGVINLEMDNNTLKASIVGLGSLAYKSSLTAADVLTGGQQNAVNSGVTENWKSSVDQSMSDASSHISNTQNPHGVTAAQVGLSNVENTALSTWTGSTNITTLGTISNTQAVWHGAKIANDYLANSAMTLWGTSVSLGGTRSGDMSNVGNISFNASGKNIGGTVFFDTTNKCIAISNSSTDLDENYRLHVNGKSHFTDQMSIGTYATSSKMLTSLNAIIGTCDAYGNVGSEHIELVGGAMKVFGNNPFIDFYANEVTSGYTARLIAYKDDPYTVAIDAASGHNPALRIGNARLSYDNSKNMLLIEDVTNGKAANLVATGGITAYGALGTAEIGKLNSLTINNTFKVGNSIQLSNGTISGKNVNVGTAAMSWDDDGYFLYIDSHVNTEGLIIGTLLDSEEQDYQQHKNCRTITEIYADGSNVYITINGYKYKLSVESKTGA